MRKRQFITFLLLIFSVTLHGQVVEKSYLTTDREVYAPGDTLWFKSYTFNRYNQLSDLSIAFHVILSDQLGNKISTTSWPVEHAMANGNLHLPSQEGTYYLHAYSGQMAGSSTDQVFRKEIHIRSTQPDVISLKVLSKNPVYHMDSLLLIDVSVQSGTSLQDNLRVEYEVWDNNKILKSGSTKTDDSGIAQVELNKLSPLGKEFHLLLKVDQPDVKTSQLTIPIALDKPSIDLQFFPEGGSFVSGLMNNVALKAIDKQGLPIDIKGRLVDKHGESLASVSSFYKGMGQFKISPKTDQEYFFRIEEPKGVDSIYKLPQVQSSGILLAVDSIDNEQILWATVQSSTDLHGQKASLEVYKDDQVVGEYQFDLRSKQLIKLPLTKLNAGTYKLKLYNQSLSHQSERLFFAKPNEQLDITIEANKKEYKAREKVEGRLLVKDAKGNPVAGDFSIAAIYKTRSLIPNSGQPNLMAHILLKSDLKGHIPTPNFYFSKDEMAVEALDLVMLTNGWRKYSPSRLPDPEAIVGNVFVKRKKNQPFPDAAMNVLSVATNELQSFDLDDRGNFNINASEFKEKGDSILIFVNTKSKKVVPNIALNTDYKFINTTFQKDILTATKPNISNDIYLPSFKIAEDKFQGVTMLNSVDVVTAKAYFRNGCSVMENNPEGWVTKTSEELDMTNPELITLLKQVNQGVKGYGSIQPQQINTRSKWLKKYLERLKVVKEAILSTHMARSQYLTNPRRESSQARFQIPIPFELCMNCDCGNPPFDASNLYEPLVELLRDLGPTAQSYYPFLQPKSLDLANLESISIRDSKSRPIILIQTKNQIVNRKIYINTHLNIVTYKNRPDQFYSPVYETQEQIEDVIPDARDILFWNHSLKTDKNGVAQFSFYNADRPQIIQVSVEGIAANGQLGLATKQYRMLDEKVKPKN